MGSLCLSAAPILRCPSLSRIQNIALIIPTAVEVVFSTSLIFTSWYSGRKHLLLTAEGWFQLALSLLNLLIHIIPAVRDDLATFRTVDTVIAALSVLPLISYIIFLYLLARSEFFSGLPSWFRPGGKLILATFIPLVIIFHELGSFLGISHRLIPSPTNPNIMVVGIGFSTDHDRTLWTVFTGLALGILTGYQALVFSLAFIRIARVFINKRRIEATASDEAHLFQGLGWFAAGLKLGAAETVIGLVQGGFGVAMSRRILRLLARALLVVGLIKGMDFYENFEQVRDELNRPLSKREKRKSRLRPFISNPRFSTFQQMSPRATAFYSSPRARRDLEKRTLALPGGSHARERVTVHLSGGAPTLHMRFSDLDMPSPITIAESVKSRPASEWAPIARTAPSQPALTHRRHSVTDVTIQPHGPVVASQSEPEGIHNAFIGMHSRGMSDFSVRSEASMSSLFVVRQLASQFPGIPPRVTSKDEERAEEGSSPWRDPYPTSAPVARSGSGSSRSAYSPSVSRSSSRLTRNPSTRSSIRRKPVPSVADLESQNSEDSQQTQNRSVPFPVSDSPPPSVPVEASRTSEDVYRGGTSRYGRSLASADTPSSNAVFTPAHTSMSSATTVSTDNPFAYDEYHTGKSPAAIRDRGRSISLAPNELPSVYEQSEASSFSSSHMRSGWAPDDIEEPNAALDAIKKNVPLARIKSVGTAPRRSTPNPVKTGYTRGSIYIEPISIPPKRYGMPEVELEQGSYPLIYEPPLRDSEVLGIDRWSNGRLLPRR